MFRPQRSQLDLDEEAATQALRKAGGDVEKALADLVGPDPERIGWRARR